MSETTSGLLDASMFPMDTTCLVRTEKVVAPQIPVHGFSGDTAKKCLQSAPVVPKRSLHLSAKREVKQEACPFMADKCSQTSQSTNGIIHSYPVGTVRCRGHPPCLDYLFQLRAVLRI